MDSPARIATRTIESFIDGDRSGEVIVGDLKLVVRRIENDHSHFTVRDSEGRPLPADMWDELSKTLQKRGYSYRYSMAENTVYFSKQEDEENNP
jgi:hypothetical protein